MDIAIVIWIRLRYMDVAMAIWVRGRYMNVATATWVRRIYKDSAPDKIIFTDYCVKRITGMSQYMIF